MNIQSLTEAEIQDIYKKKLFLETIKNGKTPRRSGLGSRLYNLAGYTDSIYCNIESNMPVKYFQTKPNLTKVLCYNRNSYNGSNMINLAPKLTSDKMVQVFEKYLKEYYIHRHWNYIMVLFDPSKVACWSIMDNDLKLMYPKNHMVNKHGFVFYRKR